MMSDRWIPFAAASSMLLVSAAAQSVPAFKPPVLVRAGEQLLGHKRLYPSPMMHDSNRDGVADIYVGDLRGAITFALGSVVDGETTFADEQKLKDSAGRELDFGNW
jgi:hypothetical protein